MSTDPRAAKADPAPVPEERWLRPPGAVALLVLAHGAGAGPDHPFMEALAKALAAQGVATLRFAFPYMAAGRPFPDRPPALVAALVQAVGRARQRAPDLPLFVGGKSLGGRMASHAAAEGALGGPGGIRGLVFYGFPLHPAGRPSTRRAAHLPLTRTPLLFLQGDRDRLAELELLEPVVHELGGRAYLHVVAGADHGFHVLKRSGRSDRDVLAELSRVTAGWMRERLGTRMA